MLSLRNQSFCRHSDLPSMNYINQYILHLRVWVILDAILLMSCSELYRYPFIVVVSIRNCVDRKNWYFRKSIFTFPSAVRLTMVWDLFAWRTFVSNTNTHTKTKYKYYMCACVHAWECAHVCVDKIRRLLVIFVYFSSDSYADSIKHLRETIDFEYGEREKKYDFRVCFTHADTCAHIYP